MTPKLEKSFSKLVEMRDFSEKYQDLFNAFRELKRKSAEMDIIINEVSLPQRWYIKYPELEKDMVEMGLCEGNKLKLLGLKWNA